MALLERNPPSSSARLALGPAAPALAAGAAAAIALAILIPSKAAGLERAAGLLRRVAPPLLLTTIILIPFADYLYDSPWRRGGQGDAGSEPPKRRAGGTNAPGGQFSGVVLLTAVESAAPVLKAPPPLRPPRSLLSASSPVTIPFSGEYWYFYWPMPRPAEDALRKLGDPKLLTYHSVDRSALIMQARQPLPRPTCLSCCQAIEVVLEVREEQPESVSVELVVLDSSAKKRVRQSLGTRELPPASPKARILRYPVRVPELQTFDEILVWFHLYEPRHGASARVAVDRFNLIP